MCLLDSKFVYWFVIIWISGEMIGWLGRGNYRGMNCCFSNKRGWRVC